MSWSLGMFGCGGVSGGGGDFCGPGLDSMSPQDRRSPRPLLVDLLVGGVVLEFRSRRRRDFWRCGLVMTE